MIGIKVAKKDHRVDDDSKNLVLDTSSLSAMIVQEHQLFVPSTGDFGIRYTKSFYHGLGYIPLVLATFQYIDDGVFYQGIDKVFWDEHFVYVSTDTYYAYTIRIVVFSINIGEDHNGNVGDFSTFTEKNIKYGIESKEGKNKRYTSSLKVLPVSKIISKVPFTVEGAFSTHWFRFNHNIGSPVMYDIFGKIVYQEINDPFCVGKWRQTAKNFGTEVRSNDNQVYVVDAGQYFDIATCVIYGTLK